MNVMTIAIIAGSILVTVLITVATLVFVAKVVGNFQKAAQNTSNLMNHGVPAQARILGVRDLGGSIQMGGQMPQHRLQLDLEVYPTNAPPYRASPTQLISMLHVSRIQTGAVVPVRFDASAPANVALVL